MSEKNPVFSVAAQNEFRFFSFNSYLKIFFSFWLLASA